jgi:hypothetical protein
VEITRRDKTVEFVAQLDRLFLAQSFNVEEMSLMGKLEL